MNHTYLMIDTDSYAGNFERQLCAACTGKHDETSIEAAELAAAYDGPDLSEYIGEERDRHGYPRPARCAPALGVGPSNSVRIVLDSDLPPGVIPGIKERAERLAREGYGFVRPFKILGFRIERDVTAVESEPL